MASVHEGGSYGLKEVAGGWYVAFGCICGVKKRISRGLNVDGSLGLKRLWVGGTCYLAAVAGSKMHQQSNKCRWLIGLEEVAGGWFVLFGCICGVKNASAEEYTQMAGNQHEGLRK